MHKVDLIFIFNDIIFLYLTGVPNHMASLLLKHFLTTECVFLNIIHEYMFFWSLVSYLTDFRWCSTLFADLLIIEISAITLKSANHVTWNIRKPPWQQSIWSDEGGRCATMSGAISKKFSHETTIFFLCSPYRLRKILCRTRW